jgi:DNA-binding transcriptional LysR family regulator
MEFRHLATFDAVATLMSFNRAAEVLHCTQSTVSAQIKALEQDLGSPLFERLGRRITLTPAGEELLHHSRRLRSYEQEVRTAIRRQGQASGLITLRVPQSVATLHLPQILKAYHQAYPHVGFDISNCGSQHLADELRHGAVDAAFLLSGILESTDLSLEVQLQEPMAFVAAPNSPLVGRQGLALKDLAGQTLLIPKHDCGYRMEFTQALKAAQVEVASIIELNSLASLVRCLTAGVGVAVVPQKTVARELAEGQLKKLHWKRAFATNLYLIYHKDKRFSGIKEAFMDTVQAYFEGLRKKQGGLADPVENCFWEGKSRSMRMRL